MQEVDPKTIQNLIDDVRNTGRLWFAPYREAHQKAKKALYRRLQEIQNFKDLGNILELLSALEFFTESDYTQEISAVLKIKKPPAFLSKPEDENLDLTLIDVRKRLSDLRLNPDQEFPLIFYIRLHLQQLDLTPYPNVKRALENIEHHPQSNGNALYAGKDPNGRYLSNGKTHVHTAIEHLWDTEIGFDRKKIREELRQLIIYGADLNAQDWGAEGFHTGFKGFLSDLFPLAPPPRKNGGNTPLHTAVRCRAPLGSVDEIGSIVWLVENGAMPHILNDDGQNAADLANDEAIREYLHSKMLFSQAIYDAKDLRKFEKMWQLPNAAERFLKECSGHTAHENLVVYLLAKLANPDLSVVSQKQYETYRTMLEKINEHLMEYYWEIWLSENMDSTEKNKKLDKVTNLLRLYPEEMQNTHQRWYPHPEEGPAKGHISPEYIIEKDEGVFKKIIKKAPSKWVGKFIGSLLNEINNRYWISNKSYKNKLEVCVKRFLKLLPQRTRPADADLQHLLACMDAKHSHAEIKTLLKLQGKYSLLYFIRHSDFNFKDYPRVEAAAREIDQELYAEVVAAKDKKKAKVADKVLKQGLDLNTENADGNTLVSDAGQNAGITLGVFKLLVRDLQVEKLANAFIRAVEAKRYDVADEIYKSDVVNLEFGDEGNATSMLHIMAAAGDLEVVKDLVEKYELDPNGVNDKGLTPAEVAGNSKVRAYLESKMTLDYALKKGDMALCKMLIAKVNEDLVLQNAFVFAREKMPAEDRYWPFSAWQRYKYGKIKNMIMDRRLELRKAAQDQQAQEVSDEPLFTDTDGDASPPRTRELEPVVFTPEKPSEDDVNSVIGKMWDYGFNIDSGNYRENTKQLGLLFARLEKWADENIAEVLEAKNDLHGNLNSLVRSYLSDDYPRVKRIAEEIANRPVEFNWKKDVKKINVRLIHQYGVGSLRDDIFNDKGKAEMGALPGRKKNPKKGRK